MIAIFDARADEFGTLGLGILEPTVCTTSESDGGLWEITLEHPVGDDMRWSLLQQMRILRVPSPMRETPRVEIDTTTVERRIYKTAVPTKQKLYLRNGPSLNAKRISLHAYGAEVQVLREANEDWSEVITLKGGEHGYMWTRYLEYVRTETETIRNDNPSTIIETHQTRDQLFRISSVETDSAERVVRVKGEHITYDLRGVVVSQEYNPENEPANVAVQRLLEYADHATDFSIYCGSSDPITAEYTGRNIIDCLFNPDDGIVKQAGLRVIRDNFEIYLLPQQERDIQAEIRYGHNMLSTALKTDTSNVITRIFPYGTDNKGNSVRGSYVDSPHVNDFPIIRAKSIEYDITDVEPDDAEDKLEELAKAEFGIIRLNGLDEWCDNLIKTWTDHQSETNAIVNQYITSYNDNTNPIIDALQEKFGDSSATDVATIRQYQTDVSTLLWSRQNGHFSTSEKTWLRNMVAAVDAMSDTCSDVGGTSSGLDAPTVSLDSDFVRLELSPAYTAIANQYALHMYDVVPVRDDEMGVVASAKMTGYEFDCILAQYTKTELGELEDVSTVYGYELATGSVQGAKLITGTVSGNKIQDAAIGYAKINAAAITQLSADSVTAVRATIRDLVAHQITTDQLYVDLANIAIAQITTANIQSANIQWANIQSLVAEIASVATAEIGSAKIGYAQIYDLAADTALIRAGSANNFFFDKLAVTSAQMVDLTVGQLTVKAADNNYYALNVDISTGNVTAQQVTVTAAEIAAGKTSTGNHIIETDLTVSELSTTTAKATEALINKLTAQRIDVAELFALQATINALDSYIIQASTIQALEGQLNVWANDKITLAVDNVKVGGTNLLKASGTTVSNSTYNIAKYDLTESIPAGEQVTLRLWGTLGTGKTGFAAYNSGGYVSLADPLTDNGDGTFSKTFEWRIVSGSSTADNTQLYIYVKPNSVTGVTSTITKIKLERGNKATDWSPAPADADTEYASIRSEITQTANEISAEVSNIKIGSTNLLPDTKKLTIGSTGDYWMNSADSSTYTSTDVRVQGFTLAKIVYTSGTARWHAFSSPYVPLTMDWYGKQITFSSYIYSADWSAVNSGCAVSLALEESVSTSRKRWGDKTVVNADGTWGTGVVADTSAPVNNKWIRFSVTFTLNETGIPNTSDSPGTFTNMKYMKIIYWLVQNGDIRFYAPKLEWGNKATTWCDTEGELVNSSLKINDTGIYLSTTGTMQIDADDPAKQARISLGTLMSLDYNGGLQAKNGNFTESLSVGGRSVMTSGEISTPIMVATSQPSGHGFLWVKPTSVTSATYTAYTAGSRDSTVHFGATNPITRSFTASTSSTLANATFTYTLDFDVYCLTDLNQVTGVSFTATATKGGSSVSFGASSAMTMTKYQLEHVTLTASSSTNLCTNANAISVAITASASSLTKLFLQSDQYMTLTISNQAGTGTQTCSVYYVN